MSYKLDKFCAHWRSFFSFCYQYVTGDVNNGKYDQPTHPHPQGVLIQSSRSIVFQQLHELTRLCANITSNIHVNWTETELKLLTIMFSREYLIIFFFKLNAT